MIYIITVSNYLLKIVQEVLCCEENCSK